MKRPHPLRKAERRVSRAVFSIGLAVFLTGVVAVDVAAEEIEEGKEVAIEYVVRLDDGTVADTNQGREPLVFEHGEGKILPALESELEGMEPGDEVEVTLPPEKAYGKLNPEAVVEVDAERIPEEARQVGMSIVVRDQAGNQRQARVRGISNGKVTLDFNHPLAGKTLHFKVKVLSVE